MTGPSHKPPKRRARPLSPTAQTKVDLELLIASGLVEPRLRPDGRMGYWPTPRALKLHLPAPPSSWAHPGNRTPQAHAADALREPGQLNDNQTE